MRMFWAMLSAAINNKRRQSTALFSQNPLNDIPEGNSYL
jgi:hypothetical protein